MFVATETYPIILVSAAPPIMAITIIEPAVLVLAPIPLIASAKIVGNMTDMKKLVINRQPTPTHPACTTATRHSKIFTTE